MEIRPFRGWRYCGDTDGDVSNLIAPPYDILSHRDKDALLARSERNIVAVDLPHVPPKDLGPDGLYRRAAKRLEQWKSSGVLSQEDRPALYVYEQTYTWAGRSYKRQALIGGVRAGELGTDVIPHERIFPGPMADRLRLTRYTRTQLSPVFGFYDDPGGKVARTLRPVTDTPADMHGRLDDVQQKLWVIRDEDAIAAVAAELREAPVFIADGHHRYTTALEYRNDLRAAGLNDPDHESNFVMFALVARDDPGLLVLPTHRAVCGLKSGFTLEALIEAAAEFSWRRAGLEEVDLHETDGLLGSYGRGAIGFVGGGSADLWIARLEDDGAMRRARPDVPDAWRKLDVAILHELILTRAAEPWRTEEVFIDYTPDARTVLQACQSGRAQLGVLLQPTPLDAVVAVARTGVAMPHKSTYFYPKLATGMVLKPLE